MLSVRSVSSHAVSKIRNSLAVDKDLSTGARNLRPHLSLVTQTGHSVQGQVVHDAPRYRRLPVTVALGHRSALVAAGLASMLSRMPECDIRLSQISAAERDSACNHDDVQFVFGDATLLKRLHKQFRAPGGSCSLAGAKFICVTTSDTAVVRGARKSGEIDEHLPVDCPQEELFAVVRRFIDSNVSVAPHAAPNPSSVPSRPVGGLAPGALRRVREYIEEHLAESVVTDVLARIAGLSSGHFNRAFRESTGDSPHHYIIRKRVAMARELLMQTSRALADIALDVGFADQSHFCRTYVAVTGETPSACRRRHR